MTQKTKHRLTENQAKRIGVELQDVMVIMMGEEVKPPSIKGVPFASEVFTMDGKKIAGILHLED